MGKDDTLKDYLKRLQELDKRIDMDDSDDKELMIELNKIINGISIEFNDDVVKNTINPTLKFINLSTNPDPEFAHEGNSGFDIQAFLPKGDVLIAEQAWKLIPTGLYFEVQKGMEVQIRSKKENAENVGLFVLNSPGTVDSLYREEIQIILMNLSDITIKIRHGDKIAQGVVCPVYGEGNLVMIKTDKLTETV
jgi:dUTP pyrophosphatase